MEIIRIFMRILHICVVFVQMRSVMLCNKRM